MRDVSTQGRQGAKAQEHDGSNAGRAAGVSWNLLYYGCVWKANRVTPINQARCGVLVSNEGRRHEMTGRNWYLKTLIRAAIGAATLDGLALGQWCQIDGNYKDLQGKFNE